MKNQVEDETDKIQVRFSFDKADGGYEQDYFDVLAKMKPRAISEYIKVKFLKLCAKEALASDKTVYHG